MSVIRSQLSPRSDEFLANAARISVLGGELAANVLAISASLNAPIGETKFGVFRK